MEMEAEIALLFFPDSRADQPRPSHVAASTTHRIIICRPAVSVDHCPGDADEICRALREKTVVPLVVRELLYSPLAVRRGLPHGPPSSRNPSLSVCWSIARTLSESSSSRIVSLVQPITISLPGNYTKNSPLCRLLFAEGDFLNP